MSTERLSPGGTMLAWRVFELDGQRLLGPFTTYAGTAAQARIEALREWVPGVNVARCYAEDHAAPASECTCGYRGTRDLRELLTACRRRLGGADATVLDACGVIGLVRLTGTILPGVDIPTDDPPTTFRASTAEILELHLAPSFTDAQAGTLHEAYGVPVAIYEAAEWPAAVKPLAGQDETPPPEPDLPAFRRAVRSMPMMAQSWRAEHLDAVVEVGQNMADGFREGFLSVPDAALTLYRSRLRPTLAQAHEFVELVLEHLAPDVRATASEVQRFTESPSVGEVVGRAVGVVR